jgi:hypothetical protein
MKKIDLLNLVITEVFSPEDAKDVHDYYMNNYKAPDRVVKLLGFTRQEWTAHGHRVPFMMIANWRKYGWPDKCLQCGQKIILDNYGWLPREHEGAYGLIHYVCPLDH